MRSPPWSGTPMGRAAIPSTRRRFGWAGSTGWFGSPIQDRRACDVYFPRLIPALFVLLQPCRLPFSGALVPRAASFDFARFADLLVDKGKQPGTAGGADIDGVQQGRIGAQHGGGDNLRIKRAGRTFVGFGINRRVCFFGDGGERCGPRQLAHFPARAIERFARRSWFR